MDLAERWDRLTVTERSGDGAIRVTVTARGVPTALSLSEAALARPVNELASAILATIHQAQAGIPAALRAVSE